MQDGELPRPMVPDNNDEAFAMDVDGEEECYDATAGLAGGEPESTHHLGGQAAGGKGGQKKKGGLHSGLDVFPRPPPSKFPYRISNGLTLLSLGRVEWLNPNFHSDRFIFPIGYR